MSSHDLIMAAAGQVSTYEPLHSVDSWKRITKVPVTGSWILSYTSAYSPALNLYVMVGHNRTILTSSNGTDWSLTTLSFGEVTALYGVCWAGDRFVIAGYGGYIITSIDGVNWTLAASGITATTTYCYSVVWSEQLSMLVAVGDPGVIKTSVDSVNWTSRTSGTTATLTNGIYANSQFVVIGNNVVLTSPDGITWTTRTLPVATSLWAICYIPEQSLYVIGGSNGRIFTSSDGITWTLAVTVGTDVIYSIAWSGSRLVVVNSRGDIYFSMLNPPPGSLGLSASSYGSPYALSINSVSFINGYFYAAGGANTIGGFILRSTTGEIWEEIVSPINLWRVATKSNFAVSIASDQRRSLFLDKNLDGTLDEISESLTNTRGYKQAGIRKSIAIGDNIISCNGTTNIGVTIDGAGIFTMSRTPSTAAINSIAFSPELGICVAVGQAGQIRTSTDPVYQTSAWTPRTSGTTVPLLDVIWTGTAFIAVGSAVILRSYDGITWSVLNASKGGQRVMCNGSTIMVYGTNIPSYTQSTLRVSIDNGTTWGVVEGGWAGVEVIYVQELALYIAIGQSNLIKTSPDGITWTSRYSTPSQLHSIAWSGERLVIGGGSALLVTSTNGINWETKIVNAPLGAISRVFWTGYRFLLLGSQVAVPGGNAVFINQ